MALFPVLGITEGDFVVVLAPIDDTDPMSVVAEKIAYHGVGKRVADPGRPLHVRYQGSVLDDDATVIDAGCTAMDVLEVVFG